MLFYSFLSMALFALAPNGILRVSGFIISGTQQSDGCRNECKESFNTAVGIPQGSIFGFRVAVCAAYVPYISCLTDWCNLNAADIPEVDHLVTMCGGYGAVDRCLDECSVVLNENLQEFHNIIEFPTLSHALDAFCPPYNNFILCAVGCAYGDVDAENKVVNILKNHEGFPPDAVAFFNACPDLGFEDNNSIA